MSQNQPTSSPPVRIFNALLRPFRGAITPLSVFRHLPDHFDSDERRAVIHSVIVGVVVWAIVFSLKTSVHGLFEAVLHWVEHSSSVFFIFGPLILGAMLTTLCVRYRASQVHYRDDTGHVHALADVEGDGLERAIALYHASKPRFEQALLGKEGVDVRWELPTLSLAGRKFLATLATLGGGGSGGLEASVTLIGESVAAGLFKPRRAVERARERAGITERLWRWLTHAEPEDLQTAQLGGIAAAVATLFGAPFAAAFFAAEVLYRRRLAIEKLIYSLIPALIAVYLTKLFSDGHAALFSLAPPTPPPTTLLYYAATVIVAILISVVSHYFIYLRSSVEQAFHAALPNMWLRHLAGAGITGLIALVAVGLTGHGPELILGPGEAPINAALHGQLGIWVAVIALVAKILATLATVGSGGSAGLLVPSVYFGTMVAACVAPFFALPAVTLIAPAMAASLVSIVNVPLAATLFTVELYGQAYMVPALVTMVLSLLLTSQNSLYRTQRDPEEQREILPGFSVRRVKVPTAWAGQTLVALQLRNRFSVTAIGLVEQGRVRLNPDRDLPLHTKDVLIVLGRDEHLERFAEALIAKDNLEDNLEANLKNSPDQTHPNSDKGGPAMAEIGVYEAMRTLRAVRRLKPDPIPDEVLHRVLEAATWAPTGGNRQSWRIIVVKDPAKKERLGELYLQVWESFSKQYVAGLAKLPDEVRAKQEKMVRAGDYLARHFHESPVICIFCFNPEGMAITDAKLDRPSVVGGGSVYPSVENLLLACRAEGLGCTLTTLLCMREPEVLELLNIPEGWGTAAAIPIGYPIHRGHGPISRRPIEEMAFSDSWGEPLG